MYKADAALQFLSHQGGMHHAIINHMGGGAIGIYECGACGGLHGVQPSLQGAQSEQGLGVSMCLCIISTHLSLR